MTNKRTNETWRDVVSLKSRFQRSVHIQRDAHEDSWLDGYVISPASREILHRIAAGALPDGRARAWSLTGPYGAGKSSLVLFASHALGLRPASATARAVRRLGDAPDRELLARVRDAQGLVAVRATGERRRLDGVLLDALRTSLGEFFVGPGAKPAVLAEVEAACTAARSEERLSTSRVVRLFEAVAAKIATSNRQGRGLMVMLDEAGKVLEHAANNPESADLHLLQELAEAAARSGDRPIVFVVVLHQGFDQYAARLSATHRNEWAKVQGRFEDLPFQEAEDQVVELISAALETRALPRGYPERLATLSAETVKLLPRLQGTRAKALAATLAATAPLHPLTSLVLGPVFRSGFAQNERSLFAFLTSSEPRGFQEHLDRRPEDADLYTLDRFYEYLRATTGFRFHGAAARQWTHAETALSRLPSEATELDCRVIRTIAVLAAAGEGSTGLRASRDTLCLALRNRSTGDADVERSLNSLRERSLLVYRKYRDCFQLWDGSDLDLDALIATGAAQSVAAGSTVRRLARIVPPRPIIPRRHAMRTGTLRYFEVRYADETTFESGVERSSEADGTLYIVVPSDGRAETGLRERLEQSAFWATPVADERPVAIGLPRNAARLRAVAAELAAMEWVNTSTAELRDDATARRELNERIAAAEATLRDEVARVYAGAESTWYLSDRGLEVASARELSKKLSACLDRAYKRAPWIQNEIINRNDLSSAAAAARRNLLEAMIERGAEPRLGIQGFPPEYAIFLSVLEAHGVCIESSGSNRFVAPKSEANGTLLWAWRAVLDALGAGPEQSRVALVSIVDHLRRPPYGMREGVIAIVLVAILLERANEVALYEDGAFVPGLTTAVAERLLRSPARFELQHIRLTGTRAAILRELAPKEGAENGLVPVARNLVRFAAGLPDYARNTRRLSPQAIAVREALLRAKEPGPLLFQLLPEACGVAGVSAEGAPDPTRSKDFVRRLKGALRELEGAFPRLLQTIAQTVGDGLGMPAEVSPLRAVIGPRARKLLDAPSDNALRALLVRLADQETDDDAWIVSLATLLGAKPPESWHDNDVELATGRFMMLRKSFRSLEALHVALLRGPIADDGHVLRLAVAEPGLEETERVAVASPHDSVLVRSVAAALRNAVDSAPSPVSRDVALVALGLYARELMTDSVSNSADKVEHLPPRPRAPQDPPS